MVYVHVGEILIVFFRNLVPVRFIKIIYDRLKKFSLCLS